MPHFAKVVNGVVTEVIHVPAAQAATEAAGKSYIAGLGKSGTWVMDTENTAHSSRGKEPRVGDSWDGAKFASVDPVAVKNTEQDASIASVVSANATQDTRLAAVESKNASQDTSIASIQTATSQGFASATSRLDAVETKNTAQDASIATATSANATQDTRLTAVESKNTTQDASINAAIATNTNQDSRLTAAETANTSQDSSISSLNTTTASHASRLTIAENAVVGILNKFGYIRLVGNAQSLPTGTDTTIAWNGTGSGSISGLTVSADRRTLTNTSGGTMLLMLSAHATFDTGSAAALQECAFFVEKSGVRQLQANHWGYPLRIAVLNLSTPISLANNETLNIRAWSFVASTCGAGVVGLSAGSTALQAHIIRVA